MAQPLDQAALDQLFLDAHTHNKWQAKDVSDSLLERLVDVMKMSPTSANCSLGLDAGPMSGFNNDGVDKEFFSGTTVKSNFLCNLAYGDPAGVFPRNPRLAFAEMARFL